MFVVSILAVAYELNCRNDAIVHEEAVVSVLMVFSYS